MELSSGAKQYLATALWSTVDTNDSNLTAHLDQTLEVSDISQEFQKQAQKDFDKFYALAQNLFMENELDFEQIGHDFWLTRNGHGAGFWDGDYVNGQALTKIVKDNFTPNEDDLREAV